MEPDWGYVKRTTLWQYEELLKKLQVLPEYPVIWKAYNHDLPRAAAFAKGLFANRDLQAGAFPAAAIAMIERLNQAGIRDWESLLTKVSNRVDCLKFVEEHGLSFEEFIDLLNYLLRWAFPFQTATRELLDHDSVQEMANYVRLKQHKLRYSFDLLEQGHTLAGRQVLASQTGLPLDFLTAVVHRADIARLPYVRRNTILAVCGAGYDTLAKIAAADQPQMEADLDGYYRRTQGKPWENFKTVIVLKEMITEARALPAIVDG